MEQNDSLIIILSDDKNTFEPFPIKFYRGVNPKEKENILNDIMEEINQMLDNRNINFRYIELANFETINGEWSNLNDESFITRKSFFPKENFTTVQFDRDDDLVEFLTFKRDNLYQIRSVRATDEPTNRKRKGPIAEKVIDRSSKNSRLYSAVNLLKKRGKNFMTFGSGHGGDVTIQTFLKEILSPKSKSESIVTFNPAKQRGFITIQNVMRFGYAFGNLILSPFLMPKSYLDTEIFQID